MSAALGELVVSLSANIAQFTSAMDKAAYEAQQKSMRMQKAFDMASEALAALGTVATAAVFTRLIANAANVADEMGKMSARTGVATEALSGFNYAASLSDVASSDLQAALVKLNVKLGEARDGSKEAQAALARFGVNANVDNTADAFAKIADQVKNTGDAATTASAMNDVFGRSFAELLPLLQGGSEGLREAAEEARALGVVIGPEFSEQAQQFNDNLTRMHAGLSGISMQITSAVLPMLVELTEGVVGAGKEISGISAPAAVMKTVFETLIVLGSEVAFVFRGIGNEIGGIAAQAASVARLDFKAAGRIHEMMMADAAEARARQDAFVGRIVNPQASSRAADTGPSGPGISAKPVEATKPARLGRARAEVDEFARLMQQLSAKQAGVSASFQKDLDTLYAGWQKGRIGAEEYAAAVEHLIQEQPFARDLERQAEEAARAEQQRQQELDSLRRSLMSEEEAIRDSYERRKALVMENTPDGSDQQTDLLGKVQADYEASITRMTQQGRDQIYQGLLTEEEALNQSYQRRHALILESTLITESERHDLLARLQQEHDEKMLELNGSYWEKWIAAAEKNLMNFDELSARTLESATAQFGTLFADIVTGSESATEAVRKFAEGMLKTIINALGQMAAQWLIYKAVQASGLSSGSSTGAAAMAANAQAGVAMAGINAFASTAAIPIVGPGLAPAAMAAAIAATEPLAATVAALSAVSAASSFAGAFDSGGNIPAGKWGIVGERGMEVVHGPASVTGRQETARMLRDLSGREVPAPPPEVNVRNIVLMDTEADRGGTRSL